MWGLMVHPALGGVLGEGWLSLVGGLCPHTLHEGATINGVSSFVIFDGIFLLAARQFSPLEAANSQFRICSGRRKLCPRATMLQKTVRTWYHHCNFFPAGVNFDKEAVGKKLQGKGVPVLSLVPFWFL
jgi:hypothetical protein